MENGLISKNPFRFMPVCRREDLNRPDLQLFLREHHKHPRSLFCACGAELDLEFALVVREERGLYYIARENIGEHVVGCFLRKWGDELAGEVIRTTRIFEAAERGVPKARADDPQKWERALADYEDFTSYARRIVGLGAREAFVALNLPRNASGLAFAQPTTQEVLSSIDAAIRKLAFRDAANGYVGAQLTGGRLRFGITFDNFEHADFGSTASVSWWNRGGFEHGLVVIRTDVLIPALADLQVFRNVQGPPYLVVAVTEPDGTIRRLLLHQICLTARHLVVVESNYEARFAEWLIRDGRAFLKPMHDDDIDAVMFQLDFDDRLARRWIYRPDFLVFGGSDSRTLEVIEVRGFKLGEKPDYDARLELKVTHYDALCRARGWTARCEDGWRYRATPPPGYDEIFGRFTNVFEAPATAVLSVAG